MKIWVHQSPTLFKTWCLWTRKNTHAIDFQIITLSGSLGDDICVYVFAQWDSCIGMPSFVLKGKASTLILHFLVPIANCATRSGPLLLSASEWGGRSITLWTFICWGIVCIWSGGVQSVALWDRSQCSCYFILCWLIDAVAHCATFGGMIGTSSSDKLWLVEESSDWFSLSVSFSDGKIGPWKGRRSFIWCRTTLTDDWPHQLLAWFWIWLYTECPVSYPYDITHSIWSVLFLIRYL